MFWIGTETDQGDYVQKIIDSLPLNLLVITWIQFLTILQNPSECGDVSVEIDTRFEWKRDNNLFFFSSRFFFTNRTMPDKHMWKISLPYKNYREFLWMLPELLACLSISGLVGNAIGLQRKREKKIWSLGKDIDPNGLYNPKPSNNSSLSMNENTTITQARPFTQSVRGFPSTVSPPPPMTGTIKTTKPQIDPRRGNLTESSSIFYIRLYFSDSKENRYLLSYTKTHLLYSYLLLFYDLSLCDWCSSSLRLVSVPTNPISSPTTTVPPLNRSEHLSSKLRTNRPTVNSLMHLYGPWILDACLLQIKDRYSRSSATNESKSSSSSSFHSSHQSTRSSSCYSNEWSVRYPGRKNFH